MKGYDLPKMKLNPVVEEFVNRIPDKEARLILSKMVEMYIQGRIELPEELEREFSSLTLVE